MDEQTQQLAVVHLGTLTLTSPHDVVERAADVARELAAIVERQRLYVSISGRKFVRVEGWMTLGAMLGITPREVSTVASGDDYESVVELIRVSDGAVIGRGSAICSADEPHWSNRPRYARRSMAVTRATSKAFRLALAWIMALAGYEATPAEEVDDVPHQTVASASGNNRGKPFHHRADLIRQVLAQMPQQYKDARGVLETLQRGADSGAISVNNSDAELLEYARGYAERGR